MNSGGHKRKMDGSEGMGFQNVMSRARATKLDPFEHMMATKGRAFLEDDSSMGREEGSCSHCVMDYSEAEDRAFCLDCHEIERSIARLRSSQEVGPGTPWGKGGVGCNPSRSAYGTPPSVAHDGSLSGAHEGPMSAIWRAAGVRHSGGMDSTVQQLWGTPPGAGGWDAGGGQHEGGGIVGGSMW